MTIPMSQKLLKKSGYFPIRFRAKHPTVLKYVNDGIYDVMKWEGGSVLDKFHSSLKLGPYNENARRWNKTDIY